MEGISNGTFFYYFFYSKQSWFLLKEWLSDGGNIHNSIDETLWKDMQNFRMIYVSYVSWTIQLVDGLSSVAKKYIILVAQAIKINGSWTRVAVGWALGYEGYFNYFKQQLGCRFDIMDYESYFFVFWHMQLYMSWYIRSFFGFTFLSILYFFQVLLY